LFHAQRRSRQYLQQRLGGRLFRAYLYALPLFYLPHQKPFIERKLPFFGFGIQGSVRLLDFDKPMKMAGLQSPRHLGLKRISVDDRRIFLKIGYRNHNDIFFAFIDISQSDRFGKNFFYRVM
jgi:hypothetical protein